MFKLWCERGIRHINSNSDSMCKPETETDESLLLNMDTRDVSCESMLYACNERFKKFTVFTSHVTKTKNRNHSIN